MLTAGLELVGALLLVVFAFVVWPPLALLVAGLLCFLASYLITRGRDGDGS